jgi:hypothetical protein
MTEANSADRSAEQAPAAAVPPTAGCMECKAQRLYTVKAWPNGNTTWHCAVCGKVVRLIPGTYTSPPPVAGMTGRP